MATRLPIDKPLLARIAKRSGNRLIDGAVGQLLPKEGAKLSLGGKLASAALVRIASRSVPGAIIVGGGLLARAIHRQRKEARAKDAVEAVSRRTPKPAK